MPVPSSAIAITTARRPRNEPPGFHSPLTIGMARSSPVAPSPSMVRVRTTSWNDERPSSVGNVVSARVVRVRPRLSAVSASTK